MKNKILSTVVLIIMGVGLLGGGFFFGFTAGTNMPKSIIVRGVSNMASDTASSTDFSVFWDAWNTINESYLRNASTSPENKVYGAVRGLVGSLNDPYTTFFDPAEQRKFEEDVNGNFSGIGAEIGMKKNQLIVIAPLKDTPASRAGLKAGDAILKINASSTQGLTVDEAVNLIRGPEGTKVTLSILRGGWDNPKDFEIMRANIVAPTVDLTMKGDIAYVQLYSFNANTDQLFYRAVYKAYTDGARGMVLDLRDDPGGYLDVAIDIAGWFLPRGTLVVSEAKRTGEPQKYFANGNEALVRLPVAVLINGGSASAAEILAGTLRDNRHVPLIGEQSFGKGTVQELDPLVGGSAIKVTVAHWVLPSGHILENGGLTPDIEVKVTDADVQAGRDPQLDKALEVVRGETGK